VYACVYGVYHTLVLALARVIECSRRVCLLTVPASLSSSYTDTEGACSADLGIHWGTDARSRVDGGGVEVGMNWCAYILLSPALHSLLSLSSPSLSFASNSVGSLFSARFYVCPASHRPSTCARPSRSTRQVAKFGYDMSFFYSITAHFVLDC
jgi:hypothetical protein